jgi:hypothetical protein
VTFGHPDTLEGSALDADDLPSSGLEARGARRDQESASRPCRRTSTF